MKSDGKMIRSRAPLRLGMAGGGTDLSPYCDIYGGSILNVSINLYAYTFLEESASGKAEFISLDLQESESLGPQDEISIGSGLRLHKAVYKRIIDKFNRSKHFPVRCTTYSDAPPGSGLGSSSTMVVSLIKGYQELLSLPLGDYDIAQMAFDIERIDCELAGGKQDQYAATFGGFNFMEFSSGDRVVVNPLRIKDSVMNELSSSLVLYFTGVSRQSARIIKDQIKSVGSDLGDSLNAMHEVKRLSYVMKENLLRGNIKGMASALNEGWQAKKKTSGSVTNSEIESVEVLARSHGATAIKVSGAGGGGFIMMFVDPENKYHLMQRLSKEPGHVQNFQFSLNGAEAWKA